jgi:peptidyl-prolyl cis-trans isomerase C
MRNVNVMLLVMLVIAGSTVSGLAQPASPVNSAAKPAADARVTLPAADSLAVTVNGKKIMESEINTRFQTMIARSGRKDMPPQQLAMFQAMYRQSILDSMIQEILLKEDCKKSKITVTPKDIDKRLDEMLQMALRRSKMTREELSNRIKEQTGKTLKESMAELQNDPAFVDSILLDKVLKSKYADDLKVTDTEIKKFYDDNQQTKFKQPEQVRASHILIDIRKLKTDEEKQAAKTKAEGILKKAQAKDADFAALAKEYSEGPSAPRGGDLNFFPRKGGMVEPFAAAAFTLQPGQIYKSVVETQFGYHIIKVTERKAARDISFAEAKADIRDSLENNKNRAAEKKFSETLKAKATIAYPPGKEPKPPQMPPMGPGKTAPAPKPAPKK